MCCDEKKKYSTPTVTQLTWAEIDAKLKASLEEQAALQLYWREQLEGRRRRNNANVSQSGASSDDLS